MPVGTSTTRVPANLPLTVQEHGPRQPTRSPGPGTIGRRIGDEGDVGQRLDIVDQRRAPADPSLAHGSTGPGEHRQGAGGSARSPRRDSWPAMKVSGAMTRPRRPRVEAAGGPDGRARSTRRPGAPARRPPPGRPRASCGDRGPSSTRCGKSGQQEGVLGAGRFTLGPVGHHHRSPERATAIERHLAPPGTSTSVPGHPLASSSSMNAAPRPPGEAGPSERGARRVPGRRLPGGRPPSRRGTAGAVDAQTRGRGRASISCPPSPMRSCRPSRCRPGDRPGHRPDRPVELEIHVQVHRSA